MWRDTEGKYTTFYTCYSYISSSLKLNSYHESIQAEKQLSSSRLPSLKVMQTYGNALLQSQPVDTQPDYSITVMGCLRASFDWHPSGRFGIRSLVTLQRMASVGFRHITGWIYVLLVYVEAKGRSVWTHRRVHKPTHLSSRFDWEKERSPSSLQDTRRN